MVTEKKYIAIEEDEKSVLREAKDLEFGANRITDGGYIALLARERLDG